MISKTTEYALAASVCLAGAEGSLTAGQIADTCRLPLGYLSKVLRLLARAGIVSSRRGPTGGFHLRRPPEAITLLEVIRAVDPFERIKVCPLGVPRHEDHLCPLHKRLDSAVELLEGCFANTTLAELVDHDIDQLITRGPDDKDSHQAQP